MEKLANDAKAEKRARIDERYEAATKTETGKAALGGVLLGAASVIASRARSKE